jgi:hypothetical protein
VFIELLNVRKTLRNNIIRPSYTTYQVNITGKIVMAHFNKKKLEILNKKSCTKLCGVLSSQSTLL